MKARLIREHGFAYDTRQIQRLVFTSEGEGAGTSIDLVPFGELQLDRQTLVWPPEMDVTMTVAGFEEALDSAQLVALEVGLQVKVASLPGLTILKLFAWGDRGRRDGKDAVDLLNLLHSYGEAGNFDRMIDSNQAFVRYIALEGNVDKTGAWLLGLDCGRLASAQTAAGLRGLWGDGDRREKLINAMAFDERGIRGARERAEDLLDLFLEGFEDALA